MIAIGLKFPDVLSVMIMSEVITPVVPRPLQRHTLGRVLGNAPQAQAAPRALTQLCHPFGGLRAMNVGAIRYPDHSPVATSGTRQAFLDQPTKRLGIALLCPRPHDRASPPVRRGILLALRRVHAGGPDPPFLSAQHPHTGQGGEQAHLGFILDVHVSSPRGIVQEARQCSFFIARLLSGQMLNGPGWAAADAIDAMQMLTDTLGTDRTPEAALVDNVDGTCSKRRYTVDIDYRSRYD
jgi:hypothetical protein